VDSETYNLGRVPEGGPQAFDLRSAGICRNGCLDVERSEWAFFEERLELIAIPGPPAGGIQADEERTHD
jgi:hypothetical protein